MNAVGSMKGNYRSLYIAHNLRLLELKQLLKHLELRLGHLMMVNALCSEFTIFVIVGFCLIKYQFSSI
jgi:hypothetical protein